MNLPAYCILRAEKLTTFGSIVGSAKHTFREIATPNADASRTHLNKTFGAQSAAAVRASIEAKLPEKRRKDAVLAIEYLITASPEWFRTVPAKQQNSYFSAAVRWLEARHGRENIVCVNIQLDETSPHLVAYVVPLTKDGRLSAKDFLGGRKVLSEMQTEFAERVGKFVGLQRGVEGTKATHTTAKQYSAALQKKLTLTQPERPPTPSIADRLTGKAAERERQYEAEKAEHVAHVERARNIALVAKHTREAQARAIEKQRRRTAELNEQKERAEQVAVEEKAKAERLARENARLLEEAAQQAKAFAEERGALQQTIAGLKEKLASAIFEIKRLAARIRSLESMFFPNRSSNNRENKDSASLAKP